MNDSVSPPPPQAGETEPESGSYETSNRIAAGALVRSGGEVLAKVASIALFVVIARELGDARFGDFIFGISFGQVLLIAAGVGTEELLTREVSKDQNAVHELLPDVLQAKRELLFLLWLVMVAVVVIGGYGLESAVAILLVGAGVAVEYQTKTYYAVFQAYERQQYIASTLIVQRFATAVAGIVAVLLGGGLVLVGAIFLLGSVLGLFFSSRMMQGKVVRVTGKADRSRFRKLLAAGLPLGIVVVLYLTLIRLDAALIAFLTGDGGDNSELGQYGAAYRLIDATMFVSFAFGGAVFPWFARTTDDGPVTLDRGWGLALKAIIALLLPIAGIYALFAPELIDLLYGSGYEGAVTPLRWLSAITVLFGVTTVVSIVVIARESPGAFTKPAALVVAQNVIFNFILIPEYGADGAAFNAVFSGVLLLVLTLPRAGRLVGGTPWGPTFISPLAGLAAMVGMFLLTGSLPWPASLVLCGLAFPAAFLLAERRFYPWDFKFFAAIGRRLGQRLGLSQGDPDEPPARPGN